VTTETPKYRNTETRLTPLLFPLLFFLVAVPWPTVIEGRLIAGLTRANAAVTVELVNLLGIPAIQHANTIEVGTGLVGIDEACSGIRSFQATLMISLFFGEYFRLNARRRIGLVLIGFGCSFIFNVVRTSLLTWVAATQGIPAISSWHDPAGVAILLGCFVSLWLCAIWFAKGRDSRSGIEQKVTKETKASDRLTQDSRSEIRDSAHESRISSYDSRATSADPRVSSLGSRVTPFVLVWLLASEIGTEAWYRYHEAHLPTPVTWTVSLPENAPGFRTLPLTEKTKRFLRFDEAVNVGWELGSAVSGGAGSGPDA